MSSSSDEDTPHIFIKEEIPDEMSLWNAEDNCRSAFLPYKNMPSFSKPVTVLTNLQRGNIQTQTTQICPVEVTLHARSAMGELTSDDISKKDIDIDEVDRHGLTPLMWAAAYGQLPTVKLLLQNKAKVDFEGEDGETALLLAASGGHHEVIRLLIHYGASVNHEDHMANTALMYASYGDHAHCVSELLEQGANFTATNFDGSTAFSIAVRRIAKQAQAVLERYVVRVIESS